MHSEKPLWKNTHFLKLWSAQTVSALGSRISREGIPLAAVLTLNATPTQLGLLSAISLAPAIYLSPFTGVWMDRYSRRKILIFSDLGRFLLLLTIPLAAMTQTLTLIHLFIIAAACGVLSMIFDIADRTYLPSLIPSEQLVEGNAKLSATDSTAEILGPAFTGVLIQTLTAPLAILLDAFSYLISAFLLKSIDHKEDLSSNEALSSSESSILFGIQTLFQNPTLRSITLCVATANFFGSLITPLYALYCIRTLHLSPSLMGMTIAVGGIGALTGASLAERLSSQVPLGQLLIFLRIATGILYFLLPLAKGAPLEAALILMFVQFFGDGFLTIYSIHSISLRQKLVPKHLLGRVNAAAHFTIGILAPFAVLAAGYLTERVGIRPVLMIASLGLTLSSLWLLTPAILNLDRRMPNMVYE